MVEDFIKLQTPRKLCHFDFDFSLRRQKFVSGAKASLNFADVEIFCSTYKSLKVSFEKFVRVWNIFRFTNEVFSSSYKSLRRESSEMLFKYFQVWRRSFEFSDKLFGKKSQKFVCRQSLQSSEIFSDSARKFSVRQTNFVVGKFQIFPSLPRKFSMHRQKVYDKSFETFQIFSDSAKKFFSSSSRVSKIICQEFRKVCDGESLKVEWGNLLFLETFSDSVTKFSVTDKSSNIFRFAEVVFSSSPKVREWENYNCDLIYFKTLTRIREE